VEHHAGDIAVLKWIVTDFWPPIRKPVIPENLPPDVDRIYLAAERNFPTRGNEEPAGAMYRKALGIGEIALAEYAKCKIWVN
jgi:hypothetical protein